MSDVSLNNAKYCSGAVMRAVKACYTKRDGIHTCH